MVGGGVTPVPRAGDERQTAQCRGALAVKPWVWPRRTSTSPLRFLSVSFLRLPLKPFLLRYVLLLLTELPVPRSSEVESPRGLPHEPAARKESRDENRHYLSGSGPRGAERGASPSPTRRGESAYEEVPEEAAPATWSLPPGGHGTERGPAL